MTININTQHPEEAFLKCFLTPAEVRATEVPEMDGTVPWCKLRPFSETVIGNTYCRQLSPERNICLHRTTNTEKRMKTEDANR